MTYPTHHKTRAISLRKAGRTHREIAEELEVALSTVFVWVKDIYLTQKQKDHIEANRNRHRFTAAEKREVVERLRLANIRYSDDSLLKKIQDFYDMNGRIPLKREFNLWREYARRFGSWNNAIRRAGFETNPVLFARKFIAKDGHVCDSFTERIIDDWLCDNHIEHKRHVRYGNSKFTTDFLVEPNIAIEFFGLAGVQANYDAIILRKRKLAEDLGLKLVELYPKDIYPINRLETILHS